MCGYISLIADSSKNNDLIHKEQSITKCHYVVTRRNTREKLVIIYFFFFKSTFSHLILDLFFVHKSLYLDNVGNKTDEIVVFSYL